MIAEALELTDQHGEVSIVLTPTDRSAAGVRSSAMRRSPPPCSTGSSIAASSCTSTVTATACDPTKPAPPTSAKPSVMHAEPPSVDDSTTTAASTCPVCWRTFRPVGRQRFCSDTCRKPPGPHPPNPTADPARPATRSRTGQHHLRLPVLPHKVPRPAVVSRLQPALRSRRPRRALPTLQRTRRPQRPVRPTTTGPERLTSAPPEAGNFVEHLWGLSVSGITAAAGR